MKKQSLLLVLAAACIPTVWAADAAQPAATEENQAAPATEVDAEEVDELSMKLANPLASLISMPIQGNFDTGFGAQGQGERWLVNVQPVIPFSLNDDWNLISRTILPVIDQSGYSNAALNASGLGDTVQSLWFSPVAPANGWIWGAGAALLFPTATDNALGLEQWGAGPTLVALKQTGPWTMGGLTNHIASFAGDDSSPYLNATFIQPFLTYVTPTKTTLAINSESTYDWNAGEWNVPINLMINQMLKIGNQPIQLQVGARYWASSPHEDLEGGWGARLAVIFIFPK